MFVFADWEKKVEMTKCLLNKGIDINNRGRDGITFLQFVNKVGWFDILNVIEGIDENESPDNKCFILIKKKMNGEEHDNHTIYDILENNTNHNEKNKDEENSDSEILDINS